MYLKHLTGRQYDPGILVISEDHRIVVVLRSFNQVYPLAQVVVVVVVVSTVAGTESEMSLPIEMVATWVGPGGAPVFPPVSPPVVPGRTALVSPARPDEGELAVLSSGRA